MMRYSSKNFLVHLVAFLFVVAFSPLACAFVDGPSIAHTTVTHNELLEFQVDYGICDAPDTEVVSFVRNGDVVEATIEGVRFSGLFCAVPLATATYSIGPFEPGEFTLNLTYDYVLLVSGQSFNEFVGSGEFVVTEARPIPTLSHFGLVLFIVAVFFSYRRFHNA